MIDHSRHKRHRPERGTALVEMALMLPILLVLTLAALDLGRAFLAKNVLHQAAREGVRRRVLCVNPLGADDLQIVEARVRQVAGSVGLVPTSIDVSSVKDPATGLDSVSVAANFTFAFPLIFQVVGTEITNPMKLTATCYMKQE